MQIPEPEITITSLIDAQHEKANGGHRAHLGCSQLGHHCDRWLWLSFRWAIPNYFPGRVLRLFRRGQNEEETVVSDLKSIGVTVSKEQDRVSFGGHVSGSIDGVALGVPEAPKTDHILEIKTHNLKSFNDMAKQGVEKSKPVHYAQMQLYMLGMKLKRALYFAICKDNDHIYTERVRLDEDFAKKLVNKGTRISLSDRMPEPCSVDPSWYLCKFCDAHSFCHETHLSKEIHCRTCSHVTAAGDGNWFCELWKDTVPTEFQKDGCESHVLHPDLVPWERKESQGVEGVYMIHNVPVRNGAPDAFCLSSKEIIHNDNLEKKVVEIFGGQVNE